MSDQLKAPKGAADPFSLDAGVPKLEGHLKPKPKLSARISNRIIGVVIFILLVLVGIFFAALDSMDRKSNIKQEDAPIEKKEAPKTSGETSVPKDLAGTSVGGDQSGGGTSLVTGSSAVPGDFPGETGKGSSLTAPMGGGKNQGEQLHATVQLQEVPDLSGGTMAAAPPPPTPEQQAENVARQERAKRTSQSRSDGLSAKAYGGDDGKAGAAAASAAASKVLAGLQGQLGAQTPTAFGQQAAGKSDSDQDEKRDFIKNAGKSQELNYLPYSQQPAVSRNELKRGTYVSMRLDSNINSDLPGMVRARVAEDIYDTVTGCRLLIPAMTIVQGAYDSKVAIGQTHNLVVWNYMGFEDGSDLNLGSMQGYDSSGAAGIAADVDNHYLRLFGLTFGMSLITAGVQLSVPATPSGTTAQTPEQAMATALTQQYGQLGAQILGKYMQVQPTLRNSIGERFMIMLPSTIVFKKIWKTRC